MYKSVIKNIAITSIFISLSIYGYISTLGSYFNIITDGLIPYMNHRFSLSLPSRINEIVFNYAASSPFYVVEYIGAFLSLYASNVLNLMVVIVIPMYIICWIAGIE